MQNNNPGRVRILAISGSLRAGSSNTAILWAITQFASENIEIKLYNGLGELPHFNPDTDDDTPPEAVQELRRELADSDGLIICTPEYAHNIPGSLKNLLDWNVSTCLLSRKPVAVIATGEYALVALLETLKLIEAKTGESTTLFLPYSQSRVNPDGGIREAETLQRLKSLLSDLIHAIRPVPLL